MTICKNQFTTDAYAEMQKRIEILMVVRTFLNMKNHESLHSENWI